MKSIRILTIDFDLVDEVDDYESLVFTRRFHKPGDFEIDLHNEFAKHFEEEHLIMIDNNPRKVGIVRHIEKSTGDSENVVIKGYSLSSIIGRRITVPPTGQAYDRLTANAETIIKGYVDRNCINPEDPSRIIPNLVIADNQNRGQSIFYQTRYKPLDEELTKISEVSGLGWEVYLDLDNKQFVFDVYEGMNLTAEQTSNPPVIFSIDFDNIANQTYTDSALGYKNRAYVAGQGEGANRALVEVGENYTGLDRIETFVDARDIENESDLPSRGVQKLEEFSKIQSFETQLLPYSNFVYERDWTLGDIVTTQNKEWNATLNVRASEITEVYEVGNLTLEVTFGKTLPGLVEKIKQEIDQPLVEPTSGVSEWNEIENKPSEFPPASHTHVISDIQDLTYEKGSWTPYLFGVNNAGSHSYNSQTGDYIKINNQVTCYGFININTLDTLTSGAIRIGGLPFIPSGYQGAITFTAVRAINYAQDWLEMGGYVRPDGTITISFTRSGTTGANPNIDTFNDGSDMRFVVQYFVN